nr:hypothetical protein [Tanacetum cinerariifolium]
MRELTEDTFSENKSDDAHEHVERVLDIISLFNIPRVSHDVVILCVFPITLTRAAKQWVDKLPLGIVDSWDLLKRPLSKVIQTIADLSQKWDDGTSSRNIEGSSNSKWIVAIKSEEEERRELGINTKELMDTLPLGRENSARFRDVIRKEVDSGRRSHRKM